MKQANIMCPDCGINFFDVKGIGEEISNLVCFNNLCPSHFRHFPCPLCQSQEKEKDKIKVHGIGDYEFICADCGNHWSSV